MKNRVIIYIIFVIFLSFFIIIPTLSFFNKSVKSENNIFKSGEWVPATTSFILNHNQKEYSNNENISSYIDQDIEHFQINIEDNKDQFISYSYKISSLESAKLFDNPVLEVFIGNKKVSQILLTFFDNQWHSTSFDLSLLEFEAGTYDLLFIANNTYDDFYFPELDIKEVTTKTLFAKAGDQVNFYPSKIVESLFVEYKTLENGQEITIHESLIPESINSDQYFKFIIPNNFYGTELFYWSVDLFNNIEATNYISLEASLDLLISNIEYSFYLESDNELNIQTSYQNLSPASKIYLAKVSPNQINTQSDWEEATLIVQKNHHQFIDNRLQNSNDLYKVNNNLVFSNMPIMPNYLSLKLCNVHFICENIIENLLLE